MPTEYRGWDPTAARLDQAHPVHPRRQLLLPSRPEWMLRAVCRVEPREANRFFPERTGRAGAADTSEAKAVCHGCPVRAACLEFALDGKEPHGVWGGLTAAERLDLVADRRATA